MLSCAKYIVLLFNFIFWLLGVGVLGLSVFLYLDSHNYVNFEDAASMYDTPFYVIMALGAIMTIVGFLGCCGAIKESSCLLGMYIFLCITMFVACGAAVWWAHDNGEQVREEINKSFKAVIREKYGTGPRTGLDQRIDQIQEDLNCCGTNGPSDWYLSKYNQGKNVTKIDVGVSGNEPEGEYKVPPSCCKQTAEACKDGTKEFLDKQMSDRLKDYNEEGCLDKVNRYTEEKWKVLIIIGVVIIATQSLALLFSFCLCCALSRHGGDK